jgi:glycosyltransferase involved in cell wall biosynthesis
MKLGYISTYTSGVFRGPLYNQLAAISKDTDVTWFASGKSSYQYTNRSGHESDEEISPSFRIRRFDESWHLRGFVWPRNLQQMLQKAPIDMIHSNEYYQPISWQGLKVAKKRGLPFVLTQRKPVIPTDVTFKLLDMFGKKTVYGSDKIIALTNLAKSSLLEHFPRLNEEKVSVIPNSIDPDSFGKIDAQGFRERYGIPADSPVMVNVGRIFPVKRIDMLVRIFAVVRKDIPDARLVLVGPEHPEEGKNVRKLVRRLALDGAVTFTGPIPNERIGDAFGAGDVFCLTSQTEAFGYSLLESMACRTPCVSWAVGGTSDIVQNGRNGFLVDFGDIKSYSDRVTALLNDRQLRKKVASEARSGLKIFELKKNAQLTMNAYKEAIGC